MEKCDRLHPEALLVWGRSIAGLLSSVQELSVKIPHLPMNNYCDADAISSAPAYFSLCW